MLLFSSKVILTDVNDAWFNRTLCSPQHNNNNNNNNNSNGNNNNNNNNNNNSNDNVFGSCDAAKNCTCVNGVSNSNCSNNNNDDNCRECSSGGGSSSSIKIDDLVRVLRQTPMKNVFVAHVAPPPLSLPHITVTYTYA